MVGTCSSLRAGYEWSWCSCDHSPDNNNVTNSSIVVQHRVTLLGTCACIRSESERERERERGERESERQ